MSLALLLWLAFVYYKIMSFQFTTQTSEWNENERIRRRRRKKMCYLIAPFLVLNLSNKNRASRNNASKRKANKKRSRKKNVYCNESITDSVSLCVDSHLDFFSFIAALLRWWLNERYSRLSTMVRWKYSLEKKKNLEIDKKCLTAASERAGEQKNDIKWCTL